MKTLSKIFISIFLFLIGQHSNAQWYIQYQSSGNFLNDIRFINRNTGWACGDNIILKTTNGGTNWTLQNGHGYLTQIHPVNDTVAYVCGEYIIMKTTNGGNNWITLREGPGLVPILNGLWFNDEKIGWFCGSRVALRTTDGGNTFIDSQFVPNTLNDIHFKNDSIGVIAAWSKTYRTTNSGVTWYPVVLPTSYESPFTQTLSFVGDTGWTVSWGGIIFKTTNYGVSWDSISHIQFGGSAIAYSIEFSSSNKGYCGGDAGKIFKSTDGGFSWNYQISVGGPFTSIYSYNDSIIWAVNGNIFNTVNGGLTKVQFEIAITTDKFVLFQNYPNPFNTSTVIKFKVKEKAFVTLNVFDISGRLSQSIVNEELDNGEYKKVFNAYGLNSGVYFYKLEIVNDNSFFSETKKLLLIK